MKKKPMNSSTFRKELVKIMPGYTWTVHKQRFSKVIIKASGIQTSGYNRISTLRVSRFEKGSVITYSVKSSGFGLRAPWLHESLDDTLAKALRGLQDHYEHMASNYSSHAGALRVGREK